MLMTFIHFIWINLYPKIKKNTPPSPLRLPIIGNLHQLGSAPHRSLKALAQKHGSLMLLHLGSVPVLIVSSAESAKEIMKTHDVIFSNRPKLNIPNIISYCGKAISFAPYGDYWRQSKSIYVLHLLNSRKVQMFRHVREDETNLMTNKIKSTLGSVIDLSEILKTLTNNVICRSVLGRKYGEEKLMDHMNELTELLDVFSVGNYIPSLSWVDRVSGLEAMAIKNHEVFDKFIQSVIEERLDRNRKMIDDEGISYGDKDVVGMLLEVQKEQATTDVTVHSDTIKVLILEMFVAGTDTAFISLEWAISELIRHPRVMKKIQQEVRKIGQGRPKITEEDLENAQHPYLKAVMKEAMRLHTPVPLLVPRESTQDVKVMGYGIRAGTQVLINAWMISRDHAIWEEPEEFKPERFLNNDIDYKGLHFEFLLFGAGKRGCPGIEFFAMALINLAVANLVYKFEFKIPNDGRVEELDMVESTGITIHRKNPLLFGSLLQHVTGSDACIEQLQFSLQRLVLVMFDCDDVCFGRKKQKTAVVVEHRWCLASIRIGQQVVAATSKSSMKMVISFWFKIETEQKRTTIVEMCSVMLQVCYSDVFGQKQINEGSRKKKSSSRNLQQVYLWGSRGLLFHYETETRVVKDGDLEGGQKE
ncbi:3-beta-hydroxylase-like [Rutidosis leptorrhynchoides]|uniref:3-beta-hydroxylase-like n=1 Tax=Rutidosis leptorrhynchoides TaxID=125765 RepID=UPI003A997010